MKVADAIGTNPPMNPVTRSALSDLCPTGVSALGTSFDLVSVGALLIPCQGVINRGLTNWAFMILRVNPSSMIGNNTRLHNINQH